MEQKNEIIISVKTFKVLALGSIVVITIVIMYGMYVFDKKAELSGYPTVQADSFVEGLAMASADGIDITVDDVQRSGGKTLVVMTMSNHQYDLADPAVKERSALDGNLPESFNVIENNMGGHHVVVEMWFEGELYGDLMVGATADTALTLSI